MKKDKHPFLAFLKYWFWYFKYLFFIYKDKNKTKHHPDIQMIYKAMLFALRTHHKVRQRYDGYPYFFHLLQVSNNAIKFRHLVGNDIVTYIAALLHDVIEDCRMTYNDVADIWGKDVADAVFACTELRGRNRDERHGPEYYALLKIHRQGRFVKICDVIANMERGLVTGSSMLKKYVTKYPHFKSELYTDEFKEMFDYIENNIIVPYYALQQKK